ncbi:hypothetical protein [Hymenobacter crusticola]|uniref:Uncharacterized protein n=1 Tax=Hymenobacter crusticola TaxID=1770526 RepID=A0A243W715_9BACT|nr:hypothetical protein [Hymenobacter crusticola]OUJ70284.1 hypothetical protein BXP70_24630 [Hymenobacter crusticola]
MKILFWVGVVSLVALLLSSLLLRQAATPAGYASPTYAWLLGYAMVFSLIALVGALLLGAARAIYSAFRSNEEEVG